MSVSVAAAPEKLRGMAGNSDGNGCESYVADELTVARFQVRLTPRGGRDVIGAVEGDTVRVRVAAPPTGGQANEALLRLLAKRLRVGRRAVRIVRGATSTHKQLEIDGITTADALRRLVGPIAGEHPPR